MRMTQRLMHLGDAAKAATERWGDVDWTNEETNMIMLAASCIDQAILARESRENPSPDDAAAVSVASYRTTVDVEVSRLDRRIAEEREWILTHGGDRAGYIRTYGAKDDPDHFGDGGEAIFDADERALKALIEERARLRHPSSTPPEESA